MKISAAIAATVLSFAAFATQAATPAEVESVTVQFADLNLDREAGLDTLYKRIRIAAKRVCSAHQSQMLVSKQAYASCINLAVTTAVAQINRPAVSEYVAQRVTPRVLVTSSRLAAQ